MVTTIINSQIVVIISIIIVKALTDSKHYPAQEAARVTREIATDKASAKVTMRAIIGRTAAITGTATTDKAHMILWRMVKTATDKRRG